MCFSLPGTKTNSTRCNGAGTRPGSLEKIAAGAVLWFVRFGVVRLLRVGAMISRHSFVLC